MFWFILWISNLRKFKKMTPQKIKPNIYDFQGMSFDYYCICILENETIKYNAYEMNVR